MSSKYGQYELGPTSNLKKLTLMIAIKTKLFQIILDRLLMKGLCRELVANIYILDSKFDLQ